MTTAALLGKARDIARDGYLNNPDATASTVDAEGWLRTGDIGVVDADGYLTIVDRLKELIKVKGYQVARGVLSADDVRAFIHERVSHYKRLRDVSFVEAIPKSPSGKILRRVLIEQERAARA